VVDTSLALRSDGKEAVITARVWTMVVSTLFASGAVATQHGIAQDQNQNFVGTWKLMSWRNVDSAGQTSYPLGEHPIGILMYGADGQMCGQMMRPDRPRFVSADWLRGTPAEIKAAFEGFV
jgi:Lipocalin-like domain